VKEFVMRHTPFALVAVLALTGCPSDGPQNPPVLWLALDGSETEVRLIAQEPPPF
jgi:hypothetical protein